MKSVHVDVFLELFMGVYDILDPPVHKIVNGEVAWGVKFKVREDVRLQVKAQVADQIHEIS